MAASINNVPSVVLHEILSYLTFTYNLHVPANEKDMMSLLVVNKNLRHQFRRAPITLRIQPQSLPALTSQTSRVLGHHRLIAMLKWFTNVRRLQIQLWGEIVVEILQHVHHYPLIQIDFMELVNNIADDLTAPLSRLDNLLHITIPVISHQTGPLIGVIETILGSRECATLNSSGFGRCDRCDEESSWYARCDATNCKWNLIRLCRGCSSLENCSTCKEHVKIDKLKKQQGTMLPLPSSVSPLDRSMEDRSYHFKASRLDRSCCGAAPPCDVCTSRVPLPDFISARLTQLHRGDDAQGDQIIAHCGAPTCGTCVYEIPSIMPSSPLLSSTAATASTAATTTTTNRCDVRLCRSHMGFGCTSCTQFGLCPRHIFNCTLCYASYCITCIRRATKKLNGRRERESKPLPLLIIPSSGAKNTSYPNGWRCRMCPIDDTNATAMSRRRTELESLRYGYSGDCDAAFYIHSDDDGQERQDDCDPDEYETSQKKWWASQPDTFAWDDTAASDPFDLFPITLTDNKSPTSIAPLVVSPISRASHTSQPAPISTAAAGPSTTTTVVPPSTSASVAWDHFDDD
jgi:hypothetical protein